MRVIRVHNYYQQSGGEDQSYAAEIALLQSHGDEVIPVTMHNRQIDAMGRLELAGKLIWNGEFYSELRSLVRRVRPNVVHFENTFPLVSPAAYYAVRAEGVPVVQSLRNYRLFCANALFLRDGHVCEDCLGKQLPWPALAYACYRESRVATAGVVALQVSHRALRTWQRQVDRFVALTPFGRDKYVAGGLPAAKVAVKPNFLPSDPGIGAGDGGYALFVGRLSEEKGIAVALEAWRRVGARMPLYVVGDGPLAGLVRAAADELPGLVYLGPRSGPEVLELMRRAALLIFPSLWYEGFPRVILEAFAVGLPIVASRLGSMETLIAHRCTGLHMRPGDAGDLADVVLGALEDPDALAAMRLAGRAEYEANYTAEQNYAMLCQIYREAIAQRAGRPSWAVTERTAEHL